jgi:hypothetical protein
MTPYAKYSNALKLESFHVRFPVWQTYFREVCYKIANLRLHYFVFLYVCSCLNEYEFEFVLAMLSSSIIDIGPNDDFGSSLLLIRPSALPTLQQDENVNKRKGTEEKRPRSRITKYCHTLRIECQAKICLATSLKTLGHLAET